MARKPPSYAAVELQPVEAPDATQPVAELEQTAPARRGRPPAARTLKEAAAPVMLYLDPAALKALKRYALDQNTKVHSYFWTPWKHGLGATAYGSREELRRRAANRGKGKHERLTPRRVSRPLFSDRAGRAYSVAVAGAAASPSRSRIAARSALALISARSMAARRRAK